MSNKEEKSKEHKKKNKYIVKDKDGNILPQPVCEGAMLRKKK